MQPDGLGVGEHGRCDLGSPPVVGQRPHGPPAAVVLFRELSRDGVRILGVQQLEALAIRRCSSQRLGALTASYADSRSKS